MVHLSQPVSGGGVGCQHSSHLLSTYVTVTSGGACCVCVCAHVRVSICVGACVSVFIS